MGDRNKQHTDYDEQAWDGELKQENDIFLKGASIVSGLVAGVAYPMELYDLAIEHNSSDYLTLEGAYNGPKIEGGLDRIQSTQVGSNPWVDSKRTQDNPSTPKRSRRRKPNTPKAPRKGKRNPKLKGMGYLKRKNNRDLLHRKSNMYIVNRF
jgi:hypothetical protein